MPILPIDTGRYGSPEMLAIFKEENRIQKLLAVEGALALAHAEVGNIPKKDAELITSMASVKHVSVERIKSIENEIKHDIASLVRALSEKCGKSEAYVHLGATSYDIVDTANSLQIKDALELIENRLINIKNILQDKANMHKETIMMGRTHGQHALPITLGFKFSVWGYEIIRHMQRLAECKKRIVVGKLSGAVGTHAGFGSKAFQIQNNVMKILGIPVAEISTQILQRDRYAELIFLLSLISTSLENFATEIRELQRPEIGEVFESFEAEKQVGSSTMPHKKNPETCERICGLARIVRSLLNPALENMVTWHERDLTHSSAERFLIPESCILTDYILLLFTDVISNLKVDSTKMLQNISITNGRTMSESVMIALTNKGLSRQKAHELLRKLSLKSDLENKNFKTILFENKLISSKLSKKEIEEALDPKNYLGTAIKQTELFLNS